MFKISVMPCSVRSVSCVCRVSYVVESTPEVFVFGNLLEERARLARVQEVHRLEEREDAQV